MKAFVNLDIHLIMLYCRIRAGYTFFKSLCTI